MNMDDVTCLAISILGIIIFAAYALTTTSVFVLYITGSATILMTLCTALFATKIIVKG